MAFTAASLADGQMAASEGSLYVSTGVKAIVKHAHLRNAGATTETVIVYLKRSGGTSRQLFKGTLAPGEGVDLLTGGVVLVMSDGDDIRGETTTATTVDYTITGATE